jgi:hypothetical protein
MALVPGSRLGHCDVTAKIDEGSMGEVWQARDRRSARQVAQSPDQSSEVPPGRAMRRSASVCDSARRPRICSRISKEEVRR